MLLMNGVNTVEVPEPPPPDLEIVQRTLTYVGCSNTDRHAWGYNTTWGNSARRVWVPGSGNSATEPYGTGGGALLRWGVNRSHGQYRGHREIFETYWEPGYPVWIQWCIRGTWSGDGSTGGSGETPNYPAAQSQINNFASWLLNGDGQSAFTGIDDVPVWVSPLNLFQTDPDQVITAAQHMQCVSYTIEVLGEELTNVNLGPITGPLTPALLSGDATHPNAAGRTLLGQQMFDFFDPYVVLS